MGKTKVTKPNQDPPPQDDIEDSDDLEDLESETGASITLTQQDLDRRLVKKAQKTQKGLLRRLGITGDLEAAVAEIERLRALEETQATGEETLETLRAENLSLQNQIATLNATIADFNRKDLLSRRDSDLLTAAREATAEDPDDVVGWIMRNRNKDYESLVDEDGDIDEELVNTLISACMKAKPAWFTSQSPPGSPAPKKGGTQPVKVDDKAKAEMEAKLRASTGF